jgi:hypothetical protein
MAARCPLHNPQVRNQLCSLQKFVICTLSVSVLCLCAVARAQKVPNIPDNPQSVTVKALPDWLSLDLQLRGRTESQTSINYLPDNTQVYELTRVWGGMNVRLPEHLSAYAQFADDHALGLPIQYTATNMRDAFDLRQAYFQFTEPDFIFRPGRQELHLGEERLIGISDWTNVSRTFDVIHAVLGSKDNYLELFSGSVVTTHETSFDRPSGGFEMHGAYATLKTLVPHVRLEPGVLIHTLPVTSQQGIKGREVLFAPTIRAEGKIPGGFNYDVSGVLERGSYVNDSIHAGAAYVKAGYTARWLPWKPQLTPEYDYATGNAQRNPYRVSTFDQFNPSNHNVFGLTDLFGWKNIKQRRVNFDMHPSHSFYVLLQGESFHVASTHDAVYNGGSTVTVSPPAGGFLSDDIGTEFDASMQYAGPLHLYYEAGVGHFWPGALMTANDHGAPNTLAYFQITYLFKASGAKNK